MFPSGKGGKRNPWMQLVSGCLGEAGQWMSPRLVSLLLLSTRRFAEA